MDIQWARLGARLPLGVWSRSTWFRHAAGGGYSTSGTFTAFWAHDRAEEKQALVDFLAFVQERRKRHPGLHIYHYADYERAHLLQLTARYGVGEAILDELLTEDVFVDLYPIVRRSIRISEGSYSIKKLEPLYMGDEVRVGDLTKGDESIQFYVDYTELRDAGAVAEANAKLEEIRAYNEYDCVSTHRLRDWLLARAAEHGVEPVALQVEAATPEAKIDSDEAIVRDRLYAHIEGIPALERNPDQAAIGLAAAAIEYHRREDKSYWWEHFWRESADIGEWEDQSGVFVVDTASVVEDWRTPEGKRTESRVIRLRGRLAPGSRMSAPAVGRSSCTTNLCRRCARPCHPGGVGSTRAAKGCSRSPSSKGSAARSPTCCSTRTPARVGLPGRRSRWR